MPRPFRLLHTADWHIGKTLFGLSLLDDQRHVLQQLVDHVARERPDVVVVAGDIYDRSVPSAEAMQLLDATLTRIVIDLQTRVVVIAGNHDGPERLGFGATLLERAGMTVRGPVDLAAPPIHLAGDGFTVALCPLPYAEPATVRSLLDETKCGGVHDHATALQTQVAAMLAQVQPGAWPVAIAHGFVRGGKVADNGPAEYSETERPLAVGGTAVVDPQVFAGFAYTALGHLHQPQPVGAANLRYSGSLLQYSFAEAGQAKSVTLVDIGHDGTVQTQLLPLLPQRPLRTVAGTLAELIAKGRTDPQRLDFVAATLTDPGVLLDPMGRLREGYPNVLHLEREHLQAGSGAVLQGDHRQRQPLDVLDDFWQSVRGESLSGDARALLVPVLDVASKRVAGAA